MIPTPLSKFPEKVIEAFGDIPRELHLDALVCLLRIVTEPVEHLEKDRPTVFNGGELSFTAEYQGYNTVENTDVVIYHIYWTHTPHDVVLRCALAYPRVVSNAWFAQYRTAMHALYENVCRNKR